MRTAAESSLGAGNHQGVPGLGCTLDAQSPPRHEDLVGQVNPGIRIHTVPLQCVLHTGGTSLRPTLRPSEPSVEGGRSFARRGWGRGKTRKEVSSTSCLSGIQTPGGDAHILPIHVPLSLMISTLNPVTRSPTNRV